MGTGKSLAMVGAMAPNSGIVGGATSFLVQEEELPFAGWSRGAMLALWMGYCAYTIIGVHSTWFIFGRDPLSVGIINGSLVSIDLWSFIHTLVFCGIGWCFPSNFWSVFAGGCLFEVVEVTIAWLQIIPNLEYGKRSLPIQFGIYGLIHLVTSWGQFCSANGFCTSARFESWANPNGDSHLRLA